MTFIMKKNCQGHQDSKASLPQKRGAVLFGISPTTLTGLRGSAGTIVPDPLPVPAKIDQTVAGADVKLQDMILTGLKYFELRNVKVDLSAQEVSGIEVKPAAKRYQPVQLMRCLSLYMLSETKRRNTDHFWEAAA